MIVKYALLGYLYIDWHVNLHVLYIVYLMLINKLEITREAAECHSQISAQIIKERNNWKWKKISDHCPSLKCLIVFEIWTNLHDCIKAVGWGNLKELLQQKLEHLRGKLSTWGRAWKNS